MDATKLYNVFDIFNYMDDKAGYPNIFVISTLSFIIIKSDRIHIFMNKTKNWVSVKLCIRLRGDFGTQNQVKLGKPSQPLQTRPPS